MATEMFVNYAKFAVSGFTFLFKLFEQLKLVGT